MKRIYENLIYNNLKKFNQMAFLEGPRQVGKTTIAKHIQSKYKESIYLNFDSIKDRKLIMSDQSFIEKIFSTNVLRDEKPLVIFDEIHKRPDWKNYIKGFFQYYRNGERSLGCLSVRRRQSHGKIFSISYTSLNHCGINKY